MQVVRFNDRYLVAFLRRDPGDRLLVVGNFFERRVVVPGDTMLQQAGASRFASLTEEGRELDALAGLAVEPYGCSWCCGRSGMAAPAQAEEGSIMTELAMRSTSGTDLVEVDPGCRIGAVRADGGAAEIVGRDASGGGEERRWRVEPTDRDLGWVTPPDGVAWTGFRAAAPGATCFVELVPLEGGAP